MVWHWLGVYIELIVSSKDGGGLIREDQRRLETSFFRLGDLLGNVKRPFYYLETNVFIKSLTCTVDWQSKISDKIQLKQ
ncbi:hypothetical protein Prudu_014245 [Prunus dulcis]|uniref:Uncharacterized protein n=1 Tax=Prunus dulcis TaxID=3755 RepID=A0A4Y1RHM4_PRUDU|nr:hypothetical protein Prudu_014245 [Prunus dulcis]